MKVFDIDTDHARVVARELAFQADSLTTSDEFTPVGSWLELGEFSAALGAAMSALESRTQFLRDDLTHLSQLGSALASAGERVDGDNAAGFGAGLAGWGDAS